MPELQKCLAGVGSIRSWPLRAWPFFGTRLNLPLVWIGGLGIKPLDHVEVEWETTPEPPKYQSKLPIQTGPVATRAAQSCCNHLLAAGAAGQRRDKRVTNRFPLARSIGRGRQETSGQRPRATGARATESLYARSCSPSASRVRAQAKPVACRHQNSARCAPEVCLFLSLSLCRCLSLSLFVC